MKQAEFLKSLITVQSIIVAGLLAWAQLWLPTYDIYTKNGDPIWTGSLSLTGIYVAVLASLLSILFAIFALIKRLNERAVLYAITTACLSFILMLLTVIFSLISMYLKSWRGDTTWHPFLSDLNPTYVTLAASAPGLIILFAILIGLAPRIRDALGSDTNTKYEAEKSHDAARLNVNNSINKSTNGKATVINSNPAAKNDKSLQAGRRIRRHHS